MGLLAADGQLTAGLFSLMDYYRNESSLELLDWCIATRDQVKSVMLFSNHGWRELDGKRIGVTDETATSIQLLRLLLTKKYGVKAEFVRLHAGVNDYSGYDAVLLIGDQALHHNRVGLEGFELVYDLAAEWYDWKKMPFVFAVWAMKKNSPPGTRESLESTIRRSLSKSEGRYRAIGELHGRELGLDPAYVEEYLDGFNYTLGDREKDAMREFRKLTAEVNPEVAL
jgi:chorismate dehydratase